MDLRKQYFDYLYNHKNAPNILNSKKEEILLKESGRSKYLYKYCNLSTTEKIIDSNFVLLQPPDDFNDPYDCLSNVNIWEKNTQFHANNEDIQNLNELLSKIPEKFKLEKYLLHNLRAAYCFAISCFSTSFNNHLMWAHYSDCHKGVCLRFKIQDYNDFHPCYYVNNIPKVNWQSKNLNLALIKFKDWCYENEWRLIKQVSRPVMRIFGSVASAVYNEIHTNKNFSPSDHAEWGEINSKINDELEEKYNNEKRISLKIDGFYLGVRYQSNYSNEKSKLICQKLLSYSKEHNISVYKISAKQNSFELHCNLLQHPVDLTDLVV